MFLVSGFTCYKKIVITTSAFHNNNIHACRPEILSVRWFSYAYGEFKKNTIYNDLEHSVREKAKEKKKYIININNMTGLPWWWAQPQTRRRRRQPTRRLWGCIYVYLTRSLMIIGRLNEKEQKKSRQRNDEQRNGRRQTHT